MSVYLGNNTVTKQYLKSFAGGAGAESGGAGSGSGGGASVDTNGCAKTEIDMVEGFYFT